MQVVLNQPFTATSTAAADLVGLGARVEVPGTRAIVSAWQPATWDATTALWSVALDAPPSLGDFLLVWRTNDPEPPSYESYIPVEVVAAAAGAPAEPADFKPTTAEVAIVTPAYTRGGFDDDRPQAGAELGVYDETTSPTAVTVQGLIDAAADEVAGRVGVPIPLRLVGLAKRAVVWSVAASISAGKLPAQTDDAAGEYRSHIANYTACLTELVTLAREPNAMRLV
jgi:hypothetical protein